MQNVLLSAVRWLSKDTVNFEVDVGVKRNMQNCNSVADVLALLQQIVAAI